MFNEAEVLNGVVINEVQESALMGGAGCVACVEGALCVAVGGGRLRSMDFSVQ